MISKRAPERLHNLRAVPRATVLLLLLAPVPVFGIEPAAVAPGDSGLVGRALENELKAAQDTGHPMDTGCASLRRG